MSAISRATSTDTDNIAIITRFELAFRASDQATIDELCDPDLVDHNPAPDKQPTLAGFKQKVASFKAAFPDLKEELQDIVASGVTVATRWVVTGSQQQELMGIPASGQTVSVEGMNFYRLKDGRVTDLWTQFDGVALLQQLGAFPTATPPAGAQRNADAHYQRDLHLDASPDAVFAALTTVSGISGWWGTATGSGSEGGELRLAFSHDHPQVFHVDTAQPTSRVLWRVLDGAWLPEWTGTTITFELRADTAGGCQLTFQHQGLTPQLVCYDDCKQGWEYVLPSLVRYVETGTGSPFQLARP